MSTRTAPPTPAPKPSRKRRWLLYFGTNSLLLSILVHVLFVVGATFLIVEHFQKKHINFQATAAPSEKEQEHKIKVTNRNKVESAPPDFKRIVTTDVSSITLPDLPEVPAPPDAPPTTSGIDGLNGALSGGPGGPGGGGPGGGIPPFGAPNGEGLTGYFYDTKQTPDRNSSGVDYNGFYDVLKKFLSQGWDESVLQKYYRSRDTVGTSTLAIAFRDSDDAPKAFGVENEVTASLWAVHYHVKVQVPQSGDYRFAGFADNVLVVKIGGTVVLDAGLNNLLNDPNLSQPQPYFFDHYGPDTNPTAIDENKHLKLGALFHVEANVPVDLDVLIGDDGGVCCFYLLIEKEGEAYSSGDGGYVQYPFFQIGGGDAPTFSSDEVHPPYSETPEPWQLVK